jgi:hypothetical protein
MGRPGAKKGRISPGRKISRAHYGKSVMAGCASAAAILARTLTPLPATHFVDTRSVGVGRGEICRANWIGIVV